MGHILYKTMPIKVEKKIIRKAKNSSNYPFVAVQYHLKTQISMCLVSIQVFETNIFSIISKALTENVKSVFADQTMAIS